VKLGPDTLNARWSSQRAFVLAAMGSAIGLGNIWRFPYITGENGGGAFVLVYVLCVGLVGLPIMLAEIAVGYRGRGSPVHSTRALAREAGKSAAWGWIGRLYVMSSFMIFAVFSGVAGWTLAYIPLTLGGGLEGLSPEQSLAQFQRLLESPARLLACHGLFLIMTAGVVMGGVRTGIERAVKWLMPMLLIILAVLVIYAAILGDFKSAFAYLLKPDLQNFSAEGALAALGQAFLSLSVATGALIAYGAYLPAGGLQTRSIAVIAVADTTVALLAGFIVFPLVFGYGLEPAGGPGLIFTTLTLAFGQMPGGVVFGTLFFVLLTIATWTSSISILEPVVAWMMERAGIGRVTACCVATLAGWLVGGAALLSFNIWAGWTFGKMNLFDLFAFITTDVMLPLGGISMAVFVAWRLNRTLSTPDLGLRSKSMYTLWRFLLAFVAPLAIALIFADSVGLI